MAPMGEIQGNNTADQSLDDSQDFGAKYFVD